jgi:hypothetical protein
MRLPERDLTDTVVQLAAPLLERLGPVPAVDDARATVALAVTFWNANVLASKLWGSPRVKELNALKKRMRGRAPRARTRPPWGIPWFCTRSSTERSVPRNPWAFSMVAEA